MTVSLPHVQILRIVGGLAVLALLSACGQGPRQSAKSEAAQYLAHARGNYQPPGPPEDPWGPYIREASQRFDMPQSWIRAVMRQESGGRLYLNGQLITSGAGAMGLMQVMPGTYDELRERHNLGDDPFDPHENIMAGVAYMREMYDIYGSPGFLAAYNAGPARLDDYLTNNRGLPDETRKYVASIGPNLEGAQPMVRSPAEQYAMNQLPNYIPAGPRYGRGAVQLASNTASSSYGSSSYGNGNYASNSGTGRVPARSSVVMAQLPEPPRASIQPPPQQYAVLLTPPSPQPQWTAPSRGGLHLISPAMAADSAPTRRGQAASGQWAIQVGAFGNQAQAHSALTSARDQARAELAVGRASVGSVQQAGRGTLWRARMTGLSKDTAVQACERLSRGRTNCIVISPDAQS